MSQTMNTLKTANIINRHTAKKTVLSGEGNLSVAVSGASVIEILGSAQDVARYVRQGNDLLIYMKDGSVIRCSGYFTEDPESKLHSELVFNDETGLTHVTFDDVGNVASLDAVELTAHATPIDSIEPLMAEAASEENDFPWAWLAGAALGGGAIGALLANDDGGETKTVTVTETETVDNTKNTPTYMVTDNQGDKQGGLTANATTDDNTPTFSGTGHPGATIQIKDSNGNTIASTMVDANGVWTVLLPTQTDGVHTWSVVQINGSESTSAGKITVNVDTTQATLTLATTANDNVINASEQSAGFTLSGSSSHLAQGTQLTVTLNGKIYLTRVDANGEWQINVPAADAAALADGSWTVSVSGQNAAGNTVTGTQVIAVDTQAPLLSMDSIAVDQILNAVEHNASLALSGKTTAEAGQTVTLTLNGQTYTALVTNEGTWALTVDAADVQALANGDHSLTVSVSDKAGNAADFSDQLTVDTTAPILTVNPVAGDNILNDDEQDVAQLISGMANGAAPGDVVTVQFGDQTFTGVVQADGSWSVGVPASLFNSMSNGQHTITVTVTDAAGNTSTATHDVTLNSLAVGITVDTISQDNVLNAQESMQPLTLSGASTLTDGSTLTVMLNNIAYTATVNGGVWSVQVPVSDVLNLANTLYHVTVSGTDATGNSGTTSASFLVDTVLPQVVINHFATDNLVNHAETQSDQILSGRVIHAAAGDTVTVQVGGKSYSATVENDLSWKVTIPANDLQHFGDGDLTFTASVTNSHGNTGTGDRDISINASLPGLRINTLSGDDIVNAIEHHQDLVVSGSSSHLAAGTLVTVSINNVNYQAVVSSNGGWQIGVPASDLQNWNAGQLTVTASAQDGWGNPVSVDHPVELDLEPVAITINTVAADDLINAAEKGADLLLSGQTQGVEAGQTVVVKFADQTFTAQVQADGSWRVTVPSSAMDLLTDSREQIGVSVTNVSGNTASASHTVTLDSHAPVIAISTIAADDILNATEAQADLLIGGTTNAPAGQVVTVTIGGTGYTTQVEANGSWSVTVPAADVASLASGTVTASVADAAGNTGSASHTLTVDTAAPVVTINTVATDDIINSAEHGQTQLVSGAVTGAAAGDAVVVTINNKTYTTVVDAAGNWSVGVPAADITALNDGTTTVSVTVTSAAGNSGSATHDVTVNTAAPVVTINSVTADDVINAAEQGADLTLSGTTTNVEAGQNVTVLFNGKSYTVTVNSTGNWTLVVPAADLATLTDGSARVEASVSNTAGNSASATHDYSVDTGAPVITISTIAADDILNATEAQADLLIGGTTTAPAGQTVTVTIGGTGYTTQVEANGSWSVTVPAADVASLASGTVTASVADAAGNTGSASHTLTVDTAAPVVTINTVATDDIINSAEHGQTQMVSGAVSGAAAGDAVVVTINNKTYTTVVDASGNWSIGVPAADITALNDGTTTVSVTVTSAAGNSGTATHDVTVNTAVPAITINSVTADDVINAAEQGADLTLSGTTTNVEAGQNVTVLFNGKSYTVTVNSTGNWTLVVPAADVASLASGTVTVSVADAAGNTGSASHTLTVDTAAPVVTINTVATDDIINSAEHGQTQLVSGAVSGAAAGDAVVVTINNKTYTTVVDAAGNWSIGVPAADITALNDGTTTVSVTVTNAAGNSSTATHDVTVNTVAPVVTINTVTADDVINAAEQGADLTLSGTTTNVEAGQNVTVIFGNKTYTASVDSNGAWTLVVPAADLATLTDGSARVEASVSNTAGNSASATHDYSVDTGAPVIAISTIAADDILNATEAQADLLIGGTTTAPAGQTVTVTIGGTGYTTQVQANGSWSVTVPAADVASITTGGVTASVADAAGNTGSVSHTLTVDTAAPVVTINTVATDDIINSAEHGQTQMVSGTVSGAAAGDAVVVTINNKTYTTVVDAAGNWRIGVPAADITALNDGTTTVSVTVTSAAGNSGTATHDVTVNTAAPVVTINSVTADDVINATEQGADLTLSGTTTNVEAGQNVTVLFNGKSYTVTVNSTGTWTLVVPAADLSTLSDGSARVEASVSNTAGNSASATHDYSVDTGAPVIAINTISADDVLNAAEQQQPLTVQGNTSAEAGQTVTVTLNGANYTAQVQANGTWSVTVPATDLAGLSDGPLTVSAVVSDKAGNESQAAHNLTVDASAPVITVNTVAGDNIINSGEQRAGQTLSGTTTAEPGQTVTLTFNGHTYQTTVDTSGNWSLFVPAGDFTGLADGNYVISVTVNDAAGNAGNVTHNVILNGDVPTIAIDAISTDDVINAAEQGAPLTLSGTTDAPAGQTVTITLNGNRYTAVVDSNGQWSCVVSSVDVAALADGTAYTVNAQVSNTIGNSASADRVMNVDLTAPAQIINIDAVQGDSGLSGSDFITNSNLVVLDGSLSASLANGETAQISLDGGTTWIDLLVNGTQWSYADGRSLADGGYLYIVRVIDAAGNVGSVDSQSVRVDTTPPAVTLISVDAITQDTGLSTSDYITHDNQISLQGSLNAAIASGEHVQISLDGGNTWTDVSVSGLSWSFADGRTLADGDYIYQLRVIDQAGNVSATTSQTVTVDTLVPDATKTIVFDSITDDSGLSSSDFITKDTSLSLQGSLGATLAPGEIVQISLDGGATWQNVTVIGNSWSFADGRTLGEGVHDYWVRVIDTAGNIGATAHQQVSVDLTPPDSAITVSIDSISTDTGYSSSDFLTNDTSLTLSGSLGAPLAAGDRVQISVDNGLTWHDVVTNGNSWHYVDSRTLPEGDQTYQVRVVDVAGNVGATTNQVVTVDLTASTNAANIHSYTDDVASSRGEFAAGTTTDDRMPVLNGTLTTGLLTGEMVRIYRADGTLVGEADVNGTDWTFQLNEPLVDGEKGEFYAVVVDAAGNEGAQSPVFDFTVDLKMYADTQNTLDTTPIITGRVDFEILPGEYVEVTINNVVYSSRNGAVVIDPKNSTWYVQLPDSDALALGTYDVKAALFKADGTEITHDDTTGELTVSPTPSITFTSSAASSEDTGTALTLGEDGTWRILSNSTVFTQNATDSTTLGSFDSVAISGPDRQQQSSFIDFDRDGLMDILGADTSYANGQQSFKYNADGSYTAFQVGAYGVSGQTNDPNGNVYGWYGGAMGIDINGDGYVDMVYGDETPNDSEGRGGYDSGFVLNTDGTVMGFDKTGAYVYTNNSQDGVASTNGGNPTPDREVSGVDLNNDGYVDITYHATSGTSTTSAGGTSSSNSRLAIVTNGVDANGNMTLTNTQLITDVFNGDNASDNHYTTLTWSDLNGDGYMDLFVAGLTAKGGATSAIFYNDGTGKLTAAANGAGVGSNVQTLGDSVNSMSSLAVDWNGDGRMDLIEIAGAAGSTIATNTSNVGLLWTNNGVNGSNQVDWSSQTLLTGANQGSTNITTGALTLDLDYDGDKDLVVFRAAGGKTEYIENTSTISNGTSMILRIADANGINAFYGNTVLLVDESTGKVVSSQVINPQGGVNMNDSSGLVYFYGLDASKSYSAVLLANGQDYGGVSSATFDASGVVNTVENVNASWGGLTAVEKNHAYVLTAEDGASAMNSALAATDGSNTVGIVGTGYNDTLNATAGTHIYNGGGGSRVVSDVDVWTAQGGMDMVDYTLAGSAALNIDLSSGAMQNTGFGQAQFVNIEGIAGGNGDDVFTGSTGENVFNGRGGNDTFNIGNGGHDTLLYKLINASDATGGNGSDVVNGFTVGTWEGTADTDRIDLRELLSGSGYTGSGSATYVNSVATLDAQAGNIEDYVRVVQNGSNTEIHVDLDGAGGVSASTTVVTLNGVQTDLATLLANHQLVIM
ncbi:Ig-like domain-containing protein [Citrobacter sedlakii]